MGGSVRQCLIASKTLLQSFVQPNFWAPRRVVKNRRSLLVNWVINQPKAAKWPISRCIYFLVDETGVSSTTFTWSGFISIPHSVTKKPRNLSTLMPNRHLRGLSFILYFRIRANASFKWCMCSLRVLLMTTMSSMYASIIRPIKGLNIFAINLWYIAPTFFSPKGMTL